MTWVTALYERCKNEHILKNSKNIRTTSGSQPPNILPVFPCIPQAQYRYRVPQCHETQSTDQRRSYTRWCFVQNHIAPELMVFTGVTKRMPSTDAASPPNGWPVSSSVDSQLGGYWRWPAFLHGGNSVSTNWADGGSVLVYCALTAAPFRYYRFQFTPVANANSKTMAPAASGKVSHHITTLRKNPPIVEINEKMS